jgi:cephalosporin-C deacetylase-like acetyl esterase
MHRIGYALLFSLLFLGLTAIGCDSPNNTGSDQTDCPGTEADAVCFLNADAGTSGTLCQNGKLMYCEASNPSAPDCTSRCSCTSMNCQGSCEDIEQNGSAYCKGDITVDGDIPTDGDMPDGDEPDGDKPDGDTIDGDVVADGDVIDGDVIDGDVIDGDLDDDCDPDDENECEEEEEEEVDGDSDEEEWVQPEIFDDDLIQDETTANCTFSNSRTTIKDAVALTVWDVSYTSYESIDGILHPITINGYAARPLSFSGDLPGVIQAHGLGGYADEDNATGPAALLGMFVLAYTGPGGGPSEGNPGVSSEGRPAGYDSGYRMFDTLPDARGSWFWGHAVAAMRGLTCLEHHPDVDPTKLGMTGFSGGAVATLISSAVDDRIVAAVPLSGTGAWDVATQAPSAWQHGLLTTAGLSTSSPQWLYLIESIDSSRLLGTTNTNIMMVNGTTDEFFPLTAHMATYDSIANSVTRRLSFAGNFDHGCYSLTGGESAETIGERADMHARGAQRLWFKHFFGTDSRYDYVPNPPVLTVAQTGWVRASVDGAAGHNVEVDRVTFWWSNDNGFFFFHEDLESPGKGEYEYIGIPFSLESNSIYFVDVVYKTKPLGLEKFTISSPPHIGAAPGAISIRGVDTCMVR